MQLRKLFILVLIVLSNLGFGQKTINDLFTLKQEKFTSIDKVLKNYAVLSVNEPVLSKLSHDEQNDILLDVPFSASATFKLKLEKNNLFSNNFYVTTSGNGDKQNFYYQPGKYYSGKIVGAKTSMAAISFFTDDIMLVMADSIGNIIIEKLKSKDKNVNGKYIIYRDKDVLFPNTYHCGVSDAIDETPKTSPTSQRPNAGNSVCIFYDCDYDLYLKKGSNATTVLNYMTGLFNVVKVLYTNENLNVSISNINIWTSQDPYTGTSSSGYLNTFKQFNPNFQGDLATLVSGNSGNYGGLAWLSGLCGSFKYNYCDVGSANYNASISVYSWPVNVVAHEMGHNLGSKHTHACAWNGNNTAIDACGPTYGYPYEGTCSGASLPTNGGTIMSYCHLGAAGMNFNNGFGPQPGTAIRNFIAGSSCDLGCNSVACVAPSIQASNISFSNVGSAFMSVNWTNGNGVGRIVVAKEGSPITGVPLDGTIYFGNTKFGSGTTIGAGEYVVYSGTGSGSKSITNLNPGATYYFQVFEYNCSGVGIRYNIITATSNPNNQITSSTGLNCSAAIDLICGTPINGSTIGGTSSVSLYNCTSRDESGPEKVYKFSTNGTSPIVATLSNVSGGDVDVFILNGCSASACVAFDDNVATLSTVPAGTYYIVVDGYNGQSANYTLTVTCSQITPLNCTNAVQITCGTPYAGTTVGGNSNVSVYAGSTWAETGPERVHVINTNTTGSISASLSNISAAGGDLDVFILNACDASASVAAGDNTASYLNAAPGVYYVVVDGFNNARGTYTLNVNASGGCSALPLKLLNFNAVASGSNVSVTWQTAEEVNMLRYEVERSVDGVVFASIGSVNSRNALTKTTYKYIDENILATSHKGFYYRLKQVEKDGNRYYSNVVFVKTSDASGFIRLVNNTFSNAINLNTGLRTLENIQFQLLDYAGRIVYKKEMDINAGQGVISLNNLPGLNKGFYLLRVIRSSETIVYKVHQE